MKRGLLAFVCVLAILASMLVVPASAQNVLTEGEGYEVGYAKVDVNPWVDLQIDTNTTIGISASDPSITSADAATYIVETQIANPMDTSKTITQKIVSVPLGGYGNSPDRLATGMMDDNGDGVIGYGDGVASTCTIVTHTNGTEDTADDTTVAYVTIDCIRASSGMTRDIRNAVVSAVGGENISADRIMVSASHSHAAPDYAYSKQNTVWKAYYDYVIARIAAAAKEAFDTKSTAEMSKGSIEAPEGMANRGYGDGVSLNFVRHAYGTYTLKERKGTSWNVLGTDTIVRTPHSGQDFTKTVNGTKYQASFALEDEVSEADETLHVLRFTREEGDPVLLVNWRAHATMNGSSTKLVISSDYVGSLRYRLENNTAFGGDTNYCVGFWQCASGNVNAGVIEDFHEEIWKTLEVDELEVTEENVATRYGRLVSEVALACLDSTKNYMQDCEEGKISTKQALFNAERQIDSAGLIAAAKACQAEVDAGTTITYPYAYKYSDGNYYVINSSSHLPQVLQRATRTGTVEMELNVMTLGADVALVTLPVEPFDRYSNDATLANANDYNDWSNLDELLGYTPFVLGYSNDHQGYMPNALAYTYGPTNEEFLRFYGEGSYESNTAKMAQGAGEAVIVKLSEMLDVLAQECKTYKCQACRKVVDWMPLKQDQLGLDLTHGHYYLAEDAATNEVLDDIQVGSDKYTETICLDMNGRTLNYRGRVFYLNAGSTLNIMDSVGDGKIVSTSGGDVQAGVAFVNVGATLNLYGGTLQFVRDAAWTGKHIGRGGVICSSGNVYMYGGTIIGGELSRATLPNDLPNYNGYGCAVFLSGGSGRFHMLGGHIQAYTGAMADDIIGNCVFVQSVYGVSLKDNGGGLYLSGSAVVDEIYIEGHQYTSYRNVSISGKFVGSVSFNFNPSISLEGEVFVANVRRRGKISEASLRCAGDENCGFYIRSSRLYMTKGNYAAVSNGKAYATLSAAIEAYNGGIIKLLSDVDSEVVVNRTIDVLDLNGYDIAGVTVNEGYTVTCMDSQTDDFTVEDTFGYGVISRITGNVFAVPVEENGYLMLGDDTNGDGVADQNVSFHRVDVDLTAISLRTLTDENLCDPSIYYRSSFAGDEIVKANVKAYGVVLSVVELPNAENMGVNNEFSRFDGANFVTGRTDDNVTSTLLRGIMMEDNDETTNETNAVMPIYGRAYMQLTDGRYVFSNSHTGSLKDLTEAINDSWTAYTREQKELLIRMYKTYQDIMSTWDIQNIAASA
ncbi:MAG: hypothetical protein IJX37_02015 [Oscillospiraceae bacterium]|nr:hypothetical protein [Oscillospiraceae bacterium]